MNRQHKSHWNRGKGLLGFGLALCLGAASAHAEAMLQFFNASWNDIADKVPELAEAGYTSIWLPPPAKANGGYSVGYDLFDPFDLGSKDQRGTMATLYGTEADLHNLVEVLHRFGMRVYFDNIMNHRAYDVPGYNETTPIDVFPGMVAEDFHLRKTADGFYRKWDNTRDWESAWQVMHLGLSDLLDIAHETPNQNHGFNEGDHHDKPFIVRHPNNPEFYDRMPNTNAPQSEWNVWDWSGNTNANIYVGFGPNNGITTNMIEAYPSFFQEDVGGYLCRAVRWMVDTTKADGLRLDAVKHVPDYFFGRMTDYDDGTSKNTSNEGYLGNVQWQYNMTHGYEDWGNHRDTVFDENLPRDDALVFGEHLAPPPGYDGYIDAGMRLVDNDLRSELNKRFSANDLWGFQNAGAGGFAPGVGVMHAQSHDSDYVDRKELHHAYYLLRQGIGLLYTDGNFHAATLTGSGGAFPRWANTAFLGQWGQRHIPELLNIHQNFAWGNQGGRYGNWGEDVGSCIAWVRGGSGFDASMLVVFNSLWEGWQYIPTAADFEGASWLYNYATAYTPHRDVWNEELQETVWSPVDYIEGWNLTSVQMPPNSYSVWGWKNPDPSDLWPGDAISVYDDGELADTIWVARTDGPDGDESFNPYGIDPAATGMTNFPPYTYYMPIPRVTNGTNVTFGVRADGSAYNMMLRLNGGIDLNGDAHGGGDMRDNPPALSSDIYLGFENCEDFFTQRIWPEKFAAGDTVSNKIGSAGAATYWVAVGASNVVENASIGTNTYSTDMGELSWVYHDPAADTDVEDQTAVGGTFVDTAPASWSTAAIPGFGEWQENSYVPDGDHHAGVYTGDPAEADIIMNAPAYVLYAEPDNNSCGVIVSRALIYPAVEKPGTFSITLGVNWDSNIEGSYKGFEVYNASGNPIFGVQMANSSNILYYGGATGTWSAAYGTNAFTVTLTAVEGGYTVSGTTRTGGTVFGISFDSTDIITGYKVYMNGADTNDKRRRIYFNNATFTTVPNEAASPDTGVVTNQFLTTSTSLVVWAKTPNTDRVFTTLYYTLVDTVDDGNWPEGAGGYPANNATLTKAGAYKHTGKEGDTDWWRFEIPRPADGKILRYKIGAARRQSDPVWDVVWPSNATAVIRKKQMLTQWMVDGQNLKTKEYHKHNNYNSWTTNGLPDGFHFLAARIFLNRNDGAPVYNTFRQTFYLDTETPRGELLYPQSGENSIGGSEYGLVLRTDASVREVWYHIEDGMESNDGPGNGVVRNGAIDEVVWAKATSVKAWTTEMAQNTEFPKLWRFTYSRIPAGGTATIRIRLREWSSSEADSWSKNNPADDDKETGHYTEIEREFNTQGSPENMYFEWPSQDGVMVEAGWDIHLKLTARMVDGLSNDQIVELFKVYVNSEQNAVVEGGTLIDASELNMRHHWAEWNGGDGENTLTFSMPNVYNGATGWLYGLRVEFENSNQHGEFTKTATRLVQHRGPLLPTLIISTPPETDSDGAKYIINMKDLPAAEIAANPALRQTPIVVLTDNVATNLELEFITPAGYVPQLSEPIIATNGSKLAWTFTWTVEDAGAYRFAAHVQADTNNTELSVTTNTVFRNTTVQFRQIVGMTNITSLDWDDDGIANAHEENSTALPDNDPENWSQEEVFNYFARGKTKSTSPDSDGDGLPDGLELGYRWPVDPDTDVTTDTNDDGWPNFIADLDPPFYNTPGNKEAGVPNVDDKGTGADRTKLAAGSVTSPGVADSDYDGIPDAVEDANRNGWVDGDGSPLLPSQEVWERSSWPDGKIDDWETWEETSPNVTDSDGDGLSDGYGEDVNFNGRTDMFLIPYEGAPESEWIEITLDMYDELGIGINNVSTQYSSYTKTPMLYTSRAINYAALFGKFDVTAAVFDPDGDDPGDLQTNGWPRLVITETDPLNTDTDGDGLPDGWEIRYGLDPLDNGVYNFRTGGPGNPDNGADGNPDGDTILDADDQTVDYTNLMEYQNGTDPTIPDTADNPGGEGTLNIGKGDEIGIVNEVPYYQDFMDWTLADLLALDDYDQGGNSSDIFRKGDGFDSSRDMVAFYFRDGGSSARGGDDKLYFRVDFDDLKAYAEEVALNIYVAINFGNYGSGELNLPDEVDAGSYMGWNACIAVYDNLQGALYVDTDPANNTANIGGNLGENGVRAIGDGYQGAYFDSELDAVAFAIDRRILLRYGWNGLADQLLFQVYTTRDFTGNDGESPGDNGGRNDFADTIGDDWLCSDYHSNQDYISQNSYFRYCIGRTPGEYVFNHIGQHAKVALVSHGNQAVEAGYTIQNIVDNGQGAGYQRPIQIHNIYTNAPLNLHITPTLAMALEWAEVGTTNTWFSGPALNEQIRRGIRSGAFKLLGSTFSDHIIRYFNDDFNAANVALATDILNTIYGGSPTNPVVSTNIFWTPERVLDLDSMKKVLQLGYQATILDQNTHLFNWYGRENSLGYQAYRLNKFWLETAGTNWPSLNAFIIANAVDAFRYTNTDQGLPQDLRRMYLRRARAGGDQLSTVFYMWEELADGTNADAYDKNLRWLANRPWIKLVALEDCLAMDTQQAGRDLFATNVLTAHDWIQHASNGDYDHWYYGTGGRHEGLAPKQFELRGGATNLTPLAYGTMTNGLLAEAWAAVSAIQNADVRRLAEQALFASVFETAFHQESNNNLNRWSYGDYMWPATETGMGLQGFAWKAQGQTRRAALYAEVDDWAVNGASTVEVKAVDLDLDGEEEYILRNNSVMAVFECSGGRMIGAWHKAGGRVYQMIGNFVSQPSSGWEDEGTSNVECVEWDDGGNEVAYGLNARRTSALKDWWIEEDKVNSVNPLYTAATNANSITFTNNGIGKTITLADATTNAFHVAYAMPDKTLYVRNGFSPDLNTLLITGQKNLAVTNETSSRVDLMTLDTIAGKGITVALEMTSGAINTDASDQSDTLDMNTVNMRNQAHTHQIEVVGTNAMEFSIILGTETYHFPVITFDPEIPDYIMPVGSTSSFHVTATNTAGEFLEVLLDSALPEDAAFTGGAFSWAVPGQGVGTLYRTNDVIINLTFRAVDAGLTTTAVATITVPWDSDGDGMGDDWELFHFGNLDQTDTDDADGDGFSNYAEWAARSKPSGEGGAMDYIGWETLFHEPDGSITLTFKCVPYGSYMVQRTDSTFIQQPGGGWTNYLDDYIEAPNTNRLEWIDTTPSSNSLYRLHIPLGASFNPR